MLITTMWPRHGRQRCSAIRSPASSTPNIQALVTAFANIDGKTYQAPQAEPDVIDRVGGGDGYASGFIYGMLSGAEPQDAVNLGWAHGALLTTFPGDTTMATLDQVKAFASGGSARIQR